MTTLLNVLAWTGAMLIVAFVVLMLVLVPLGLLDRFRPQGDLELDDDPDSDPLVPPQFQPYVPRNQPHLEWPDYKLRRDTGSETDPDL